jgi:hypothetical protein
MIEALPGRAGTRCFCCQSAELTHEWAALSPFFAMRTMAAPPQTVGLIKCNGCGTRYFDYTPTEDQLGRLYAGYRGEAYFRARNGFEPWYTRAANDDLGAEKHMRARRTALAATLQASGVKNEFRAVLDYGGDRGQMLLDLHAELKAVFDISGVTPDPGVTGIDEVGLAQVPWDLILCCHVLEHLPDPQTHIAALRALGHAGTSYYFEVPDEAFASFPGSAAAWQGRWITWLTRHTIAFKLVDFLSVVCRLKLRVVPPLFFVVLREHLNFYSVAGLSALLRANGFEIHGAKTLATGAIGIVAVQAQPRG